VFNVNAYGTFAVNAAVADAINSQYPDDGPFHPRVTEERGCIVNISSVVARPVPGRCLTYGPSKSEYESSVSIVLTAAAVLGITEGMADFLGPSGIRVNSVAPAVVASTLMGPDRLVCAMARSSKRSHSSRTFRTSWKRAASSPDASHSPRKSRKVASF